MTYIKKYSENANFSIKLHNYENNNDAHFRLSRSNLFGHGDLTKISLYYFGTFANYTDQL